MIPSPRNPRGFFLRKTSTLPFGDGLTHTQKHSLKVRVVLKEYEMG